MSLVVVVKGTEGLVLAADSRVTITPQSKIPVSFDNATKLMALNSPHNWIGAVTWGAATIGGRTPQSLMTEFELSLSSERLSVYEYAEKLGDFFLRRWNTSSLNMRTGTSEFYVGGYDNNKPYGTVYYLCIPDKPVPMELQANQFGISWGGQSQIVHRILLGYDPRVLSLVQQTFNLPDEQINGLKDSLNRQIEYRVAYDLLPLQECVDLATLLIRTTITTQNLATELRGVGGPIDVATITHPEGFKWIQRKEIRGE